MLVLRILLVALAFPLATFVFGWAILPRSPRLDREERFAAAWGVGIGVLAASQFVAFVTAADQTLFNACVLALMLAVAVFCLWDARRSPRTDAPGSPW